MTAKGRWWVYVVLTAGLLAVISPFVWMLLSSVKPAGEILGTPPTWLPGHVTGEHYRSLFERLDLATYLTNSVAVAVAVTVGNMVFCSMLGYVLAKLSFRGRRLLFGLVMGMLMVPGMVTFVPLFILVSNVGLANTYSGLILPYLVQPVGVFLMRQFIGELPDELIDAARVDGAGEARIFARIVLPLCGPALATLGIITFLASWNNFLWPLVVAQTEDMYTMPVALALYSVGQNSIDYGLLLAGAVVVVVPVLLLFTFLQRHFTQGIATTGFR
ncbi:carbohydrate ABC transporter permease [Kibdelosporangium persicum]|uniref:Binding-protein-dependent transport systems inner membrane component n=1 Tax=Kibdelosporangium persicum TaxID=2698649 RepID=A0ABX2EWQ4_9PSEU|nr:carbohydrate ABC transporter permease [Kibdelosporangium persicum]NRN63133.1 Binding-protein-dependent transport systems inner membrane component [Kibdelosporangium persicum]